MNDVKDMYSDTTREKGVNDNQKACPWCGSKRNKTKMHNEYCNEYCMNRFKHYLANYEYTNQRRKKK